MSYAPLPFPQITDAPNVPSDLGRVAAAIETQALSQYSVYNSTNTPSATSIENRLAAVDGAAGTVAALEGRISTLSGLVSTWTAGSASKLSAQIARTNAFPARQSGHDTTIASLSSQLSGYEPQITNLVTARPAGILSSRTANFNLTLPVGGAIIDFFTFIPRAGTAYYRFSFSGSLRYSGTQGSQGITLSWVFTQGTTPQTGGYLAGTTITDFANDYPYVPISCTGVAPISGDGHTQWTTAINGHLYGPDQTGSAVTGLCSMTYEDLGPHF